MWASIFFAIHKEPKVCITVYFLHHHARRRSLDLLLTLRLWWLQSLHVLVNPIGATFYLNSISPLFSTSLSLPCEPVSSSCSCLQSFISHFRFIFYSSNGFQRYFSCCSQEASLVCSEETSKNLEGVGQSSVNKRSLFFKGQNWKSTASPVDLDALRVNFNIPNFVVLEVPGPQVAAVYSDGMAAKVVLFPLMFVNGLQLLFCHPICYVLDHLRLAPTQLYPNAWWLLITSWVIYRMVLSSETK